MVQGPGDVPLPLFKRGIIGLPPLHLWDQNFTIGYGNLFSDSTPGLQLWFDANDVNADNEQDDIYDFISGDRVSMWGDKSGKTNNPIQATLNKMPRWTPDVLNEKPILEFDLNATASGESLRYSKCCTQCPIYFYRTSTKHNWSFLCFGR